MSKFLKFLKIVRKRAFRSVGRMLLGKNRWLQLAFLMSCDHPKDAQLVFPSRSLVIKPLGLEVAYGTQTFLLESYERALLLSQRAGAVYRQENGEVFVSVRGLEFLIETAEETFILCEVFVYGCYAFTFRDAENTVLIDVGGNIGIATCYFAGCCNFQAVETFEPFEYTFSKGVENVSRNGLQSKVRFHNFGLGCPPRELEVAYSKVRKGTSGIFGVSLVRETLSDVEQASISIKDVKVEMLRLLERYPKSRFALKIDCEGSEYEIVPRLPDLLLEKVDFLAIEWHEQGPEALIAHLLTKGFCSVSTASKSGRLGMLYAFRAQGSPQLNLEARTKD